MGHSTEGQLIWTKQKESPDISTTTTWLVISIEYPWLAASPDGLVYDPGEDPPYGVIEFKNPCSVEKILLDEAATKTRGFIYNVTLTLTRTATEKESWLLLSDTCLYTTTVVWPSSKNAIITIKQEGLSGLKKLYQKNKALHQAVW